MKKKEELTCKNFLYFYYPLKMWAPKSVISYEECKGVSPCIYRGCKVISSACIISKLMATITWLILKILGLGFEFWTSL